MPTCRSDIVDCLKQQGLTPTATSHSVHSNHVAQNALTTTRDTRYHSSNNGNQYWYVDFKKQVYLDAYQVNSDTGCNWIYKWDVYCANSTSNWTLINSPEAGHPVGKMYILPQRIRTQYFKLATSSHCSYYMAFYYIRFFGSIQTNANKYIKITCLRRRSTNTKITVLILLVNIS